MKELLKQLVNGQEDIVRHLGGLEKRMGGLENRMGSLENRMGGLENRMGSLEDQMGGLKDQMGGMDGRMSGLESQVQENTDLINALIHNVEVANAKIDGLALNTVSKEALSNLATKEDISHLTAQIKVISTQLFNQEVEICKLKAVE